MLNGLAWLVRWRLLPSLAFLAPLIDRVINVVRWGEHRGGMFVSVAGLDAGGVPVERSWHMVAEGVDGPLIPSMAAEAIVRNAVAGRRPEPGARPGDGELSLADYEALFARRAIRTGRRRSEEAAAGVPLYRRLLGEAWDGLPSALRALHGAGGPRTYRGRARVERGTGVPARLAARLFGLPAAGEDVPVEVRFTVAGAGETWRRDFAGLTFASRQSEGRGRWERLLVERFGPVAVGLALLVEDGRLRMVVRRWSLLGIPMPMVLAPGGNTFEAQENGRFTFHVEIGHPLTGRMVRYRGWLEPVLVSDAVSRG
ncbi:DUF4166 domain-containing protein [uncultured Methylobacterium sp.]|uniref:DUF4166 domain-containing protein n=1 Tax=uncultured Methylobacterium sp. TaxID=157278 RepID=UPI0035CC0D8C